MTALGADANDTAAVAMHGASKWSIGLIGGLLRTTDAACAVSLDEALAGVYVSDVQVVPATNGREVLAVTSSVLRENFLYAATDRGASYWPRGEGFGDSQLRALRIAPSDAQVVYVSAARPAQEVGEVRTTTLYRSDDGGESFRAFPVDLDDDSYELWVMAVDPQDPMHVFAVMRSRAEEPLLRSRDGGATFETVLTAPGPLLAVALDGEGRVWAGGESAGLFRSRDGGGSFESLDADLAITCLEIHDGALWACNSGLTQGFQVGRSEDGGESFEPLLRFADLDLDEPCTSRDGAVDVCAAEREDVWQELELFRQHDGELADGSETKPHATGCAAAAPRSPSAAWPVWLAWAWLLRSTSRADLVEGLRAARNDRARRGSRQAAQLVPAGGFVSTLPGASSGGEVSPRAKDAPAESIVADPRSG